MPLCSCPCGDPLGLQLLIAASASGSAVVPEIIHPFVCRRMTLLPKPPPGFGRLGLPWRLTGLPRLAQQLHDRPLKDRLADLQVGQN